MAKKKLESEEAKATPELDYDFNDEFSSDLNQEAIESPKRSAVFDVVRGAGAEVGKGLINPNTYKDILKQTMPKEYGDITAGAAEVTGGLKDLYNQTFQELNPKINSIFKSLDRFVPESQKTLKKLVKKIDLATGGRDFNVSPSVSKEEQTEQAVAGILGDVFEAQRAEGKIAQAKQVVRDKIETDRFNQSFETSSGMARDISTIAQYTTKITQAYQRKDLEISARTYLANQEFHAKVVGLLETTRAQQEAIVKNTALPDYAKITKSEEFWQRTKGKVIDSLYGEGTPITKAMNRIKGAAGEFVRGISNSLSMMDMALDGAASQKEMIAEMNQQSIDAGMGPLFTKAEMAGTAMGMSMIGYAKTKAAEHLGPIIDENNDLKEKVAKISKYAVNPGAAAAKFRQSEEWQEKLGRDGLGGKAARLGDFLLEQFQDSDGPNRTMKTGHGLDDLDEPQPGMSKRAILSLTTIIPGHLSYIHREIQMLRTGRNDAPLMTYDYKQGEFTTKDKLSKRILKDLEGQADRSTYGSSTERAANNLLGDKASTTSDATKLGLRVFLSRLAREDDVLLDDIDAIRATDAYQSMSPDVQSAIDDYFSEISSGEQFEQKTAGFTKDVRGIRSSMPSLDKHLKSYVDAGYGDLLEKEGLMKKAEDGDRYDIDEERFYQMLEERLGAYPSDMNVKKNIKATSPSAVLARTDRKRSNFGKRLPGNKEAYEGMRKTKLFNYRYKDKMGDTRPHDGPMAQDVQQNLGNDVAPNGKAIDVQSMSASFFGAVQYLGDKYDQLFKRQETTDGKDQKTGEGSYISQIARNTAETNRILSTKGVVLGGIVGGTFAEGGKPIGVIEALSIAVSQGARNIKSGVIDPAMDYGKRGLEAAGDFYQKNKDPFFEALGKGKDFATAKLSEMFGYADRTIRRVPDAVNWAKEKISSAVKSVKDAFTEYKDLYLPDGTEPVIRAAKIRMGFYIDEATGEPLTTMEQIYACKNNIVDKSGNIILDAKDRAQGLYDRYGDRIKGFGLKVFDATMKVGGYMFGRAKDLYNTVKSGAIKGLGDLKNFFSEKGFFRNGVFDFNMAMSGVLKRIHDETINIRDIMLGDKDDVMKRLKKKMKGIMNSTIQSFLGNKEGSGDDHDQEANPGSGGNGQAPDSFGVLRQGAQVANRLFGKAKDKFYGRFGKTDADGKRSVDWEKMKGIGGDKAAGLRNRAGGFMDRMKSKISPKNMGRLGTAKGLMSRGFSKGKGLVSGAIGLLGGLASSQGQDQQQGPEPDKSDGQDEKAAAVQRDKYDKINEVAGKGTVAANDRAWNDKDGSGERDGGVAEREEHNKRLKEARTKDMLQADLTPKYLGLTGGGGLLGMSTAFLSSIGDGISTLFDVTSNIFKKLPGMDKILGSAKNLMGKGTGALSNIGKSISQKLGTQAARVLGQGAARQVGTAALRQGGSFAARQLAMTGLRSAAVIGLQGLAASSAGAMAVAAAPIILTVAAIAATTYGLYKLYKYSRRDDATKYDQLRLRQYGFAYRDNVYRFNHYAFQLEDYLQDERVGFDELTKKAFLIEKKIKHEELLETMDIDPKNTEEAANFSAWFKNRFRPVFIAHMTGLYKQDPKLKLKQINKLKPGQILAYLEDAHIKDTSVYNYDISPVKELEYLDVNTEDIETSFKNLMDKEKELDNKTAKDAPIPEKVEESKTQAKTDLEKQAAEKTALALGMIKAKEPTNGSNDYGNKVKQVTPEERKAAEDAALAAGDGKNPNTTSMQNLPTSGSNDYSGQRPPPVAGGAILTGQEALKYIVRQKPDVDLENMNPAVLRLFLGMVEEYGNKTGRKIQVNSAFRSYEKQAALHRADPRKASKPGGSLHELGFAIDINSADANALEKEGLMKKYGFTRPVGGEPWHLEPAGIQKSIDQAKRSREVAEAMVEAGIGHGGGGYGTLPNSAQSRRNNALALSLLDMKGEPVKEGDKKDDILRPVFDTKATAQQSAGVQAVDPVNKTAAANDASYSKAQQLPASTEGARARVTADAETPWSGDPGNRAPDAKSLPAAPQGTGKEEIKRVISESAKRVGIDPGIPLVFAAAESGFNPNAKAGSSNGNHSSAAGLMQFLDGTWRGVMKQHGAKYGIDPSTPQTDPVAASLLGAEYIKDNMRAIRGVRPNPTAGDVYMAHFLGPGGAKKFFSGDMNAPAASVMPKEAASNRSIFFDKSGRARTGNEVYQLMTEKLQKRAASEGINVQVRSAAQTTTPQATPSNNVSSGSFAANDAVKPTEAKANAGLPGQGAGFTPPPISSGDKPSGIQPSGGYTDKAAQAAPRSPFSYDTRFPGKMPEQQQAQPAPMEKTSLNSVEGLMTKSVDIQEKSYQALRQLVEMLNPEKFGAVVAQATAAAIPKPEAAPLPDAKKQDQINMGRTTQVTSSSLDLRRLSA